ncbi:PREDICTED: LOW QUALITY PROTEIN: tubulin-specific chaperone C [Calidris pugnax]|uniref:LOW QUALITY PROTEIN: tubulin-specific chaperone C n=1 Tax=Calidris pugnax TaxID=198806 RepID=UPI00071D9175|nr:PREDICTED: LOW QUALITY PROTEIN: tubulin-specific chaperone C [Calidris pugnax]
MAPLQPEVAAAAVVLPERLQRREAERQQGVERQRQKKEAQVVKEEQSEFFLAAFAREREAVEELLAAGRLEEAAARLQGLQKLLTESVRFPPPKKDAAPGGAPRPAEPPPPEPAAPAPGRRPAEGEEVGPPLCGFGGAEGEELELGPAELLQRDVVLSELRGCRVRLRGNANTLRVRDCRGCTVLCGPVSTSVLVDGCSDCLLVLACQQLRTHRTRDSRFYVQVTSRAVIEDCTKVSFAPYTWSYPGIERDFESSGLDRNRNNWNLVDDFDWLATDKPSPNWSLIPEQERISSWD